MAVRQWAVALLAASCCHFVGSASGEQKDDSTYEQAIPPAVRGPFVSNPDVLTELDCPDIHCDGPLNFTRLMLARASTNKKADPNAGNPFNLSVAQQIQNTIQKDLTDLATKRHAAGFQLKETFLTDEGSRVELVGVINRMDRQFIKDTSQRLTRDQLRCGEISVIYRFGYSLRDRDQKSRLPVTLNIVFPALPSDTKKGAITCRSVAQRWLDSIRNRDDRDTKKSAAELVDAIKGPLAFIDGRDMLRLELNIQGYRKPASVVDDFGTEAAYVLRVFKWLPDKGYFDPDFMRNQIDRDKLTCTANDTMAACDAKKQLRRKLVKNILDPKSLESLDNGTFEVDDGLRVFALRGISISPGGSHRSDNQPYWNADTDNQQIITDEEIDAALQRAAALNIKFSFIKSKEDVRTRLNEGTCTGCHQTRAIAGFHFPGADRAGTSSVNSVLLPGSPHFYGDQIRRMEILEKIASGRRLNEYELATGYSARPLNKYQSALDKTQLIGGWGGACLTPDVMKTSQRQWTCRDGFVCVQLFKSKNEPGIGTCVPDRTKQVGDALQIGTVSSAAFGKDHYKREEPKSADTRIPASALPADPPPNNSYYGSHQEYYQGDPSSTDRDTLRDAETGGFPSGMLRLSECQGLPDHATCGLVASTGFNRCIGKLGADRRFTMKTCFELFTSYAGLRACDAGTPCRDDYICVKPMEGYEPGEAQMSYDTRKNALTNSSLFKEITNRPYEPDHYYGQLMPDLTWINKRDRRGLCIPPYFVFQFRADGHPAPAQQVMRLELLQKQLLSAQRR